MLLYMAQLLFSLCNTWKDPVHILGMVGLTSAWVWPRDLLKYHGIRRRQGWQGHSTLRAIESICRNVPTTLELWFTGDFLTTKQCTAFFMKANFSFYYIFLEFSKKNSIIGRIWVFKFFLLKKKKFISVVFYFPLYQIFYVEMLIAAQSWHIFFSMVFKICQREGLYILEILFYPNVWMWNFQS